MGADSAIMSRFLPKHIGTYYQQGADRPFFLTPNDRGQHVYAIGKTGSGKTTFLKHLIVRDILAGHGVGVIDPHGDLAEELLDYIPKSRTNDVVYFDPADSDFPISFNLLDQVPEQLRPLVASGVVGAFKNLWEDSWGPRLEYILYACVAALLDCDNTSLLGVPRLLTDHHYREWVIRQIKDPIVRYFWTDEFAHYDKQFATEAVAPIQNKVGQLFMTPAIRNMIGQVTTKIDARFMMDNSRIFIANLSKGRLGEDKTRLLGSLFSTWFATAAMSRVDTPIYDRRPFHLTIDEFQNFATGSFVSILSEARKYKLALTLSHQYVGQLSHKIRDAVFGNVGTLVSFRIGGFDAEVVAREMGLETETGLTSLERGEVYVKTIRDGSYVEPFVARIDPLPDPTGERRELLRQLSRQRFATPRPIVEDRIRRWLDS